MSPGSSMRVTFDTNTLDKATRPERFPKDPNQPAYFKVHEALKCGLIHGFVCDTIITLEGVQNKDRALVFGSTTLSVDRHQTGNAVHLNMQASQPARPALPSENARRLAAATAMGVRVLSAPRIASPMIADPDKQIYAREKDSELEARLSRFHDVARAIQNLGLGTEPAKRIVGKINQRIGSTQPWYKALALANANEEKEFARAVREWADCDTVAAHVGYQNDILCTEDTGKAGDSIFSLRNRKWLAETYDLKFATINQLAALIVDS